jgi:hypothetical protein
LSYNRVRSYTGIQKYRPRNKQEFDCAYDQIDEGKKGLRVSRFYEFSYTDLNFIPVTKKFDMHNILRRKAIILI